MNLNLSEKLNMINSYRFKFIIYKFIQILDSFKNITQNSG